MIVKVCGIKTEDNIHFLSKADIDMIGLNFYEPSVRYVSNELDQSLFDALPEKIKRVGVFVNESLNIILEKSAKFKLDFIQLHGDENAEFCTTLAESIPVIKVFRIDDTFDFSIIDRYHSASYYLFDTQTKNYGGSGKKFDWEVLNNYHGQIPFLLSGGIGPADYDKILEIDHPQFAGIDINSKFESAPGIKDKNLVLPFISIIKTRD